MILVCFQLGLNYLYNNLQDESENLNIPFDTEKHIHTVRSVVNQKVDIKEKYSLLESNIIVYENYCVQEDIKCTKREGKSTYNYEQTLKKEVMSYNQNIIIENLEEINKLINENLIYVPIGNESSTFDQIVSDFNKLAMMNFSLFDFQGQINYLEDLDNVEFQIKNEVEQLNKEIVYRYPYSNDFFYVNNSEQTTNIVKNNYPSCKVVNTWYDRTAEVEVYELTNSERQQPTKNLYPSTMTLTMTEDNELFADDWANHQLETGELHHPETSDYHDDIKSIYGENILFKLTINEEISGDDIFQMWYESPGHYENFMSSEYEKIDISVLKIDFTCDGIEDLTYGVQRFQ